jgi:uncharacterized membrane protein YebE (DUF533 family)
MNAASLIEQLLKAGTKVVGQQVDSVRGAATQADMGKYAKGAAVGGLLGLLLGSRGGRQLGGKAVKLGSMAAIGMLAWKTYQEWQAGQQAQAPAAAAGSPAAVQSATPTQASAPSFQALPAPQMELHGQAMLKAMIAAAKSDGHVDEREKALVDGELLRTQADPELRAWVTSELARPLDAADVAAAVSSPQMAAEVYLASLLVVDDTSPAERAYLDALATKLSLPAELKASLEARVRER